MLSDGEPGPDLAIHGQRVVVRTVRDIAIGSLAGALLWRMRLAPTYQPHDVVVSHDARWVAVVSPVLEEEETGCVVGPHHTGDYTLDLVDIDSGELRRVTSWLERKPRDLAFSPDGRLSHAGGVLWSPGAPPP